VNGLRLDNIHTKLQDITSKIPCREENTTAKMLVFFLSRRCRCRTTFIFEHSGFWLSDYGENAIYVSRGTPSGEAKMMGSRRHLQLGVWPRYSLLFPKRANVAIQNNTHIIWLVLTP